MRPVFLAALLGGALYVHPVAAQSASSQPEGSTSGSNGTATPKKRGTSATDSLFENGPERPHALADARREESERQPKAEKSPEAASLAAPPPAPALPTVQAVPPGPPQKNLTGDEFRLIRVGSTVKEVLNILGPPSSRVVVPDDDGHLRETLQYWVKGVPAGTVRLDNGRVAQIETEQK